MTINRSVNMTLACTRYYRLHLDDADWEDLRWHNGQYYRQYYYIILEYYICMAVIGSDFRV